MQDTIRTDATAKVIRKELNKGRSNKPGDRLKGTERANATTVAVLSDAVREAGDDTLADILAGIAEFLPVWAENLNMRYGSHCTFASDRNKFIALDYGSENGTDASGCFLVEKATGYVWSIKGYGKKNRVCFATVAEAVASYRATNAHNAEATARMEARKAARLAAQ